MKARLWLLSNTMRLNSCMCCLSHDLRFRGLEGLGFRGLAIYGSFQIVGSLKRGSFL